VGEKRERKEGARESEGRGEVSGKRKGMRKARLVSFCFYAGRGKIGKRKGGEWRALNLGGGKGKKKKRAFCAASLSCTLFPFPGQRKRQGGEGGEDQR